MKTVVARIRENKLLPVIQQCEQVYQSGIGNIQAHQIEKFNQLWQSIQKNVPFYQDLVQKGAVDAQIQSWDDFARFPILTRASLQADVAQYMDPTKDVQGWSTTGGSTGTPFRVPYGTYESQSLMNAAWMGRRFYNIQISDRMFHLWGHSHLFGNGWRRYVYHAKRQIKNWLLGTEIFSAYHLTPQRLREAGKAILRMRPDLIVGYSRSLLLLAKENENLAEQFHKLRLKLVVATTEAFSQPDDAAFIERVFGCPVAMEYGAAETGVIAYTHPSDGRYQAFWDTYLLEAVPVNETDAKLLITSLYPRTLPFIRYDIGDAVHNYTADQHSVVRFDYVLGRDNDLIDVGDGAYVHPVALIQCAQYQKGLLGVQIIQEKDRSVTISILCENPLPYETEQAIRRNLATLHAKLGDCKITYVDQLEQTIAGKTRWVIRR